MKKNLFLLLITILISVIALSAYAEQSGAVQVGTSDELIEALMGEATDIILTDDIVLMPDFGTHFETKYNINYYTPIFNFENRTIDGQGHTLTFPNYSIYPLEFDGNEVSTIEYPSFVNATFKNLTLLDLGAGNYETRSAFTGAEFVNCHLTGSILPCGAVLQADSDYAWILDSVDGFWTRIPCIDQSTVINGRIECDKHFDMSISADPYSWSIKETETIISGTGYLGADTLELCIRKPLTYSVQQTKGHITITADVWNCSNFAEEGFMPVVIQTTLDEHSNTMVYCKIDDEYIYVDLEIQFPRLQMKKSERTDEEWIALAKELTKEIDLTGLKIKNGDDPVIGITIELQDGTYVIWNDALYKQTFW